MVQHLHLPRVQSPPPGSVSDADGVFLETERFHVLGWGCHGGCPLLRVLG